MDGYAGGRGVNKFFLRDRYAVIRAAAAPAAAAPAAAAAAAAAAATSATIAVIIAAEVEVTM